MLKEQFGSVLKKGNYREVLTDKSHPATQSLIDFIAWGVTHFYGFAALIGAITFLGLLLGGWGVVFGLALAFVYATYKKEIDEKVREMKGQSDGSSSSAGVSTVDRPRYRHATASSKDFYYQIHSNCTSCGMCVPYCRSQAIFQISQQFIIDQTRCNQCGDCEFQCPVRAILRVRD
jgi:NAD-dependent dihydropyrimidine dehydrogenase PreA subunit